MKINNEISTGIIIVLAVLIFIFGMSYLNEFDFQKKGYSFYVEFDNSFGLNEGDLVTVSGVKIGKVNKIELVRSRVIMEIWINEKIAIPVDSKISVRSLGFLGEKCVNISLGSEGYKISQIDTVRGHGEKDIIALMPEIENLIGEMKKFINNFNGVFNDSAVYNINQSIKNIKTVTEILTGKESELDTVFSYTYSILNSIKNMVELNRNNIDNTLSNLSENSNKIGDKLENLDSTVRTINSILTKINDNKGTIGELVNERQMYIRIDSLTSNLNRLVTDLSKNPKKYFKFSIF